MDNNNTSKEDTNAPETKEQEGEQNTPFLRDALSIVVVEEVGGKIGIQAIEGTKDASEWFDECKPVPGARMTLVTLTFDDDGICVKAKNKPKNSQKNIGPGKP